MRILVPLTLLLVFRTSLPVHVGSSSSISSSLPRSPSPWKCSKVWFLRLRMRGGSSSDDDDDEDDARPYGNAQELPDGWHSASDAKGRTYYWNAYTKQTTWAKPDRRTLIWSLFPLPLPEQEGSIGIKAYILSIPFAISCTHLRIIMPCLGRPPQGKTRRLSSFCIYKTRHAYNTTSLSIKIYA
jgi:hypothetical protein